MITNFPERKLTEQGKNNFCSFLDREIKKQGHVTIPKKSAAQAGCSQGTNLMGENSKNMVTITGIWYNVNWN